MQQHLKPWIPQSIRMCDNDIKTNHQVNLEALFAHCLFRQSHNNRGYLGF